MTTLHAISTASVAFVATHPALALVGLAIELATCDTTDDAHDGLCLGKEMTTDLRYRGVSASGTGMTGVLSPDTNLIDWVKTRYERRWRRLTVICNGEEAGGITQHPDTGRRIWWAEG